jgi:hypothetical protein
MGWFGDPTSQRYGGVPPTSRMREGEPLGAREWGVATSVKKLGLVDAEGDRGLAEAPIAGGAARDWGLAMAQGDCGLAEAL